MNTPTFSFALRDDLKEEKQFLPRRAHETDTGWDVRAAMEDRKPLIIKPFQKILIPLGFRAFCPEGFWYEIKPRSSTFVKKSLHCLYGTIDTDFEGQLLLAAQYIPELECVVSKENDFGYPEQYAFSAKSFRETDKINGPQNKGLRIEFGEAIGQIIPIRRQEMEVAEVSNEQYQAMSQERNATRKEQGWGSSG